MTATNIRKGEAFIWLPPRSVGERAFATEPRLVALLSDELGPNYRLVSIDALPELRAVTLLFDARDVSLLRAKVPPLAGAKLRKALPHLVEDQLLQDANSCAFAIGPGVAAGAERLIAVIDRNWLEFVVGAFERRGVRVQAAWPAQLALPLARGESWSLLCLHDGLALRSGPGSGIGWPASTERAEREEAIASLFAAAAQGAESARRVVVFAVDESWDAPVASALGALGVTLDGKVHGMPAPQPAPVDLLSARTHRGRMRWLSDLDWRAWRWPAALAAAAVVAGLIGINLHWAQLAQERDALRITLERNFRQAFPDTQVVVDPVLQMQREVAALRTRAGQSGPGDFVPLLARFGQALGPQALDALASVDYRDATLRVKFRPAVVQSRAARDNLLDACRRVGLRLQFDEPRESSLAASVTAM